MLEICTPNNLLDTRANIIDPLKENIHNHTALTKVSKAFPNWKPNRKCTVTFPRAFPRGLGGARILAGNSAKAGFPLAYIISYRSLACGWEGWSCGGLSGL